MRGGNVPPGISPQTARTIRRSAPIGPLTRADRADRVDVVNIMTFDYYLASEPAPLDMGAEAVGAAQATHAQLATLYPGASPARLRAMEGITLMPGIDGWLRDRRSEKRPIGPISDR